MAWKHETHGRIASFIVGDVRHYAPEMWIMGRASVHERGGIDPSRAHFMALNDWIMHCDLEARHGRRP